MRFQDSTEAISIPWFERKQQDDRLDRCHRATHLLGNVIVRPRMSHTPRDSGEQTKQIQKPSNSDVELDLQFMHQIMNPFNDMLSDLHYPQFSEEQHRTLVNRARTKLDGDLRVLFKRFKKKRSRFDNGGMFPKNANRVRTEALFRVEVSRELNFDDIVASIAAEIEGQMGPLQGLLGELCNQAATSRSQSKSRSVRSGRGQTARTTKHIQAPSRPKRIHPTKVHHRQIRQQKQSVTAGDDARLQQKQQAESSCTKEPLISESPPMNGNQENEEDRRGSNAVEQSGHHQPQTPVNLDIHLQAEDLNNANDTTDEIVQDNTTDLDGTEAGTNEEDWDGLELMTQEQEVQVVRRETPTLNLPRLKTNIRDWLQEHHQQKQLSRGVYQGDDIHSFRTRSRAKSPDLAGPTFRISNQARAPRPSRPRYLPNRNPNVNIVELKEGHDVLSDYPVPRHALEAIKLYHLKEQQTKAVSFEPAIYVFRSQKNAGLQLSCFTARVTTSSIHAILDPKLAPQAAIAIDEFNGLVQNVVCNQTSSTVVRRRSFVHETQNDGRNKLSKFGDCQDMPGLLLKLEALFPVGEMRKHCRKLLYGDKLPAEWALSLDLMQNLEISLESKPHSAKDKRDLSSSAKRRNPQMIKGEAQEYAKQLDQAVKTQGENVSWLLALMCRRAPAHTAAMQRWSELVANEVPYQNEAHPVPLDGKTSAELETAWKQLQMPGLQKLDMVLKYTSKPYHAMANAAVSVLSAASDHIAHREEMLQKLMIELTAAKEAGQDAMAADRVVKMLQQMVILTGMSKFYCNLMFEEFEEVVTFKGTSYFEKIDQDNKALQEAL